MKTLIAFLLSAIALGVPLAEAKADTESVEVTASYRERIALPSGAELDVHLLDLTNGAIPVRPIASQRFAMTTVPQSVSLSYDTQAIRDGTQYGVSASIYTSDGQELFRSERPVEVTIGEQRASANLMLTMLGDTDASATPVTISGVFWTATEVFGEPWPGDERGTMLVDEERNVSLFGGCNRFTGQLQFLSRGLAFPENLAGTMMACPDDVEALERRFLSALMRVTGYVRYGAGLVMTDAQGHAVLHFIETVE